jgi:TonB-dependent starch-binding outer membrane protein SusC
LKIKRLLSFFRLKKQNDISILNQQHLLGIMKSKIHFLLFLLTIVSTWVGAQSATLKGRVSSDGAPVPGATIQISGTSKGAVADENGSYMLTGLDAGTVTIKVSSVGFGEKEQTVTLKTGQTTTLDVSLSEDEKFLEQVVVTGLSINAKQKELGTSRATMSGDQIRSLPAPTIENAMVGRMAGVEAYSTDGAPGGGFRFRIRGGNSLLGASEPLVIIDGVIMDNSNRNNTSGVTGNTGSASFGMNNGTRGLNAINPNDIESLEVLKGAAAASLYGSRASSGVIVVKTKSGGNGKLKVNYNLDIGTMNVARPLQNYKTEWNPSEIQQWVDLRNASLAATARMTAAELAQYQKNPMRDWSLEPFRTGTLQKHTLNFQGGNRILGYYATLNTQNTEGYAKGQDFRTYGGRISLTSSPIDRLSIRANLSYNKDFRSILPGGSPGFFIPNAWTATAIQMPFMRQEDQRAGFVGGVFGIRNPDEFARIQKRMDVERFQLSGNVNYKITEDLSVDVNAGIDSSFIDGRTIYPRGVVPSPALFPNGRLDYDNESLVQKTLTVGVNHVWKINDKFYLKSAVGTQYDDNQRIYYYKRFQVYSDVARSELDTLAYTQLFPGSQLNFNTITRTFGVYVNETFGIGNKLFINLGGRFDRSTAFIPQFFFYPRASASYQLNDNMRFRASFGQSGIQPPPYQIDLNYIFEGAGWNGSLGGYRPLNPPNNNLKPETQSEFEVGADASLFKKRVNVEVTFYRKTFTDMLFNASVAPDQNFGFARIVRNVAQMYNQGLEFAVNASVLRGDNFEWNIGFNGATLKNEVTKLNDPVRPEAAGPQSIAQLRPGYPIGGFWSDTFTITAIERKRYIGSPIPSFEGNFNTSFTYKGITLSAMLGGKTGFYRYNSTDRDLSNPAARMHKDYWNMPQDQLLNQFNDFAFWVQKADFLKLRQLNLSYTYNKPATVKGFVRNFTVGIAGANLLTWSKYKGAYDIESETSGSGGGNAWVRGVDAWEGGMPRSWTLSLGVGF